MRERLLALRPSPLKFATAVTICAAVALTVWIAQDPDPMAGEPTIRVAIKEVDPITTASTRQPDPQPEPPEPAQEPEFVAGPEADVPGAVIPETREAALVQSAKLRLPRAPLRALVERSPQGPLPRIAKDGRKPFDAYARPVSRKLIRSKKPKVALLIGGMGINIGLTQQAVQELPGEISFAFAPYGKGLQTMIDMARRNGHEVLLQLPMEPFGYPSVDPGPKTLLTSASSAETLKNLKWFMGRFAGYAGVTNYMGARFTSNGEALVPVLRELKKRGLVYLDDGSSSRSIVASMSQVIGLPSASAHVVIDAENSYNAITAALNDLESRANQDGFAIGTGTGLSVTVDAVKTWARDLSSRGVILVPVSYAFKAQTG